MEIVRINTYCDPRFSQAALHQHGCYLAEGDPYEIEILSAREAVVRGPNPERYPAIIAEFRFYAPHITVFYDENRNILLEFPPAKVLTLRLEDIQPSQFYVDEEKLPAIRTFIHSGDDIIIQVMEHDGRYISLDGHTRLYYAVIMGWQHVRAVPAESDSYIFGFVEEALARNIRTPRDLKLVTHGEYEENWNKFCDNYFAQKEKGD